MGGNNSLLRSCTVFGAADIDVHLAAKPFGNFMRGDAGLLADQFEGAAADLNFMIEPLTGTDHDRHAAMRTEPQFAPGRAVLIFRSEDVTGDGGYVGPEIDHCRCTIHTGGRGKRSAPTARSSV